MSDLAAKFTALESQMTTQQTEVINALDAIIEALGGAIPTPTTTLASVVTAIGAQTSAQAIQHTAVMALLTDIFDSVDLIITNNSLNAQRMLGALVLLDPCRDCALMPTLPPIIDVTPQEVDVEHCQRMQALLYALLQMAVKMDVVSTFGTGFSLTVIQDSLDQVFSDLGSPAGLLLPSFVETSRLVASLVVYVASNIFSPESIPFSLQSLHDALLIALYDTNNADMGLQAYAAVINGSDLSSQMKSVLIALGYNSLFNFYYDTTSAAPFEGFDGGLCAPPEEAFPPVAGCITLTSELTTFGDTSTLQCIVWPNSGVNVSPASVSGAPADLVADKPIFGRANITSLWVYATPSCHCYFNANGVPDFPVTGVHIQLPPTGGDYYAFLANPDAPFTLTICVEG